MPGLKCVFVYITYMQVHTYVHAWEREWFTLSFFLERSLKRNFQEVRTLVLIDSVRVADPQIRLSLACPCVFTQVYSHVWPLRGVRFWSSGSCTFKTRSVLPTEPPLHNEGLPFFKK